MRTQLFAAVVLTLVSFSLLTVPVKAAEIVGTQSYQVSWTKEPGGLGYQIYYGQTNTHVKDSSVAGLAPNSERLTLNSLKSCTQYTYNVLAKLSSNTSKWLWKDDPTFMTAGCGTTTTTTKPGVTLVSDVMTSTTPTGKSSSTIGWSKTPGASGYVVYYRNETSLKYDNAVRVPAEGTSLTINALTPGMNYYYQVFAVVNGKEVGYGEKMLQTKIGVKPVLGAKTTVPAYGTNKSALRRVLGAAEPVAPTMTSCNTNKKVTLTWGTGTNAVSAFHVVYSTVDGVWQHSVRNLSDQSRSLTIGSLNSCARYWFEVWAVGPNGKVTRMNPIVTTL